MTWYIYDGQYPHIQGVEKAEKFKLVTPAPKRSWIMTDGQYAEIQNVENATGYILKEPYMRWVWKSVIDFSGMTSDDYPVLTHERNYSLSTIYQPEPVHVYDMKTRQEDFSKNGLRILCPSSCKITEELNGKYELILEHPIDDDGAWKHVLELNIIKAMGQLFAIYKVVSRFDGEKGKITAYARHISYQLNDAWIHYLSVDAQSAQEVINAIMKEMDFRPSPEGVDYNFTVTSDIVKPYLGEFSEQTPISALMGTGSESILNSMGGKIFRDNFRMSINEKMEGAQTDSFDIRVGFNLTGIERSVDYTDFCTYLITRDNFGQEYAVSYEPMVKFAHNVVRSKTFKYEAPDYDALVRDTHTYFESVMFPRVTYTVRIKDLKNNPDFAKVTNLSRYRVGDTGRIFDERLGISLTMEIIKTVKDAITGETLEVTFGNFARSLTRPANLQNTIATKGEKMIFDQIAKESVRGIEYVGQETRFFVNELVRFAIDENGGIGGLKK